MTKRTWLTKEEREHTEAVSSENIIEVMKLNGFFFRNAAIEGYNYFDRDNMSGFVTTRNDGKDVITMSTKGCKYSVILPISEVTEFFISERRRGDALNVCVNVFGFSQVFSTK